jgi:hypothetical protein
MALATWSRKRTTKFAMKMVDISTTQETLHIEVTNEENPHYFLQYQENVHFAFTSQGQSTNVIRSV